jgi:UDP-glucose 4-epimerase
MPESILIIGAGGFIGRHLTRAVAASGHHVIAVSRRPLEFASPQVEEVTASPENPQDFGPLVARCGAVVHVASASTPGSSAGAPGVELRANLLPTVGLLETLQDHPGTRLVYVSSGGSLYAQPEFESADDRTRVSPRSYHGAGKAAAEHFIAAWCAQYGSGATILRPSNVFGPGQAESAGFAVVPTALGKILRDDAMTVWGDGSVVRDFLFVDDFVDLCRRVLASPGGAGVQTFKASSNIGVSLDQLFATIDAVTGRRLRREYRPKRTIDAGRMVMDSTVTRRTFGWNPETTLTEGLKKTWGWLTTIPH